ncbi:MAG: type II toxin-antitoxin system VapC family toxin [Candidatus Competibacteraceae bacterium]|nr:type II toxin-antitoxin system VapC family toxin [Candidatus Competibacteraceae bacterium]
MTRFLLDTDSCIYLLNCRPGHENILQRMDGLNYGEVLISAITLAELRYGIAASRRRAANQGNLELFLAQFEAAAFDEHAAAIYGPIRAHLRVKGTPIGSLDTLIAAHAQSLQASLVTNNIAEFCRVPDLALENWLEPL